MDEETRYATLTPLGIQDWSLCTIVPEGALHPQTTRQMTITRQLYAKLILLSVATFVILMIKERRSSAQLRRERDTDALTQLLNREATTRAIEAHLANPNSTAIHAFLLLDIDEFKSINDTFGHTTGDQVICDIAALLQSTMEQLFGEHHAHILGRLGGDEFIVFLPNIPHPTFANDVAQELRLHIIQSAKQDDKTMPPYSSSIGVSCYPAHGNTFHDLYHTADLALYRAKAIGKNVVVLYSEEMQPQL